MNPNQPQMQPAAYPYPPPNQQAYYAPGQPGVIQGLPQQAPYPNAYPPNQYPPNPYAPYPAPGQQPMMMGAPMMQGAPGTVVVQQTVVQPPGTTAILIIPPYIQPAANVEDDVATLHKAIKGLGTDEKALIRVICHRTKPHLAAVNARYKEKHHETLEKAVKGDCSGHFCELLLGRIRPNELVKAKAVKKATKGAGTNDGRLIDIFAFSTNAEIAQIKAIEKNTEKMVDGDTSGYFQKGLKDLMKGDRIEAAYLDDKQAELDAEVLHRAGEAKVGTDEKTFIRILCNHTPWYNAHISRFYTKKYSHDLLKAIKKETSGDFEKLLLALVMEPYAYWADRIYHAMKGAGTDDKTLVYVFSILSQTELLHVNKVFTERHHKDMKKMIEGDTSGWYQKALLALLGH